MAIADETKAQIQRKLDEERATAEAATRRAGLLEHFLAGGSPELANAVGTLPPPPLTGGALAAAMMLNPEAYPASQPDPAFVEQYKRDQNLSDAEAHFAAAMRLPK